MTINSQDVGFLKTIKVAWDSPVPMVDADRYQRVCDDNDRLTTLIHETRTYNDEQRKAILKLLGEKDELSAANNSLRADRRLLLVFLAALVVALAILFLTHVVRFA